MSSTDQQSQAAAVNLTIDRDAAGRFGISPGRHRRRDLRSDRPASGSAVFTQLNAYHVLVEAPQTSQVGPNLFDSIYLLSPITGKRVPLSYFVKADPTAHEQSIHRPSGTSCRQSTLSFNLGPGVALGQVTTLIEKARIKLAMPATVSGSFQGTAQAFQQSLADEPILIVAALLSVYVILGVLYESYVHPLTILSTLPSAGLGALLRAHRRARPQRHRHHRSDPAHRNREEEWHHDRGCCSETGARTRSRAGNRRVQASHQRLRPILMTTACAFLGGFPMIFSLGTGSEFRRPLGIAIVGGLLVSQVLTLFSTPVIYVYLDRLRRRFERDPSTDAGSKRSEDAAALAEG